MSLAIYFRGHVWMFPWACMPYLKSVSLAIMELFAFIAQNVRVTEVSKKISSRIHVLLGFSLRARTPNLMFVSFAITELYWHLTYKFL